MNNTNFDLIKSLSRRGDAAWQDRRYHDAADCESCERMFVRLREIDEEAIRLLSDELTEHVRNGAFPGEFALARA